MYGFFDVERKEDSAMELGQWQGGFARIAGCSM